MTPLLSLAVVVCAALAVAGWLRSPGSAANTVRFVPVSLENPFRARQPFSISAKLSPDGKLIAYHGGGGRLYVLNMSTGRTAPLSTDLPSVLSFAFSPRSDSIVVRTTSWMGQLFAVSLLTGQGRMIADSALNHEPDWNDDGWVYYGDLSGGLSRVRSDGSRREAVLMRDSLGTLRLGGAIEALPGGRGVIYGLVPSETRAVGGGEIEALNFASRERVPLGRGTTAVYSRTGHLLLLQVDGSLLAAPFDLDEVRPTAGFTKLMDSVESKASHGINGAVSLADDGSLLFIGAAPSPEDEILWLDRAGRVRTPAIGAGGWVVSLSLSPQGAELAATIHRGGQGGAPNIWSTSLGNAEWRRITFGNVLDYSARFVAGGREIAFVSPRGGRNWDLYVVPLDGSQEARVILDRPGDIQDPEFAPEYQWVVFCERDVNGQVDLLAYHFGADSAKVLAATPGTECEPTLSPDGRWLAYTSNESGRNEVYVIPFPAGGTRWQVSTQGASGPRWSHNGSELFFRSASGAVVVLPVSRGATFSFGTSRVLFDASELGWMRATSPDDQAFLMVRRELRAPGRVVLVRNWASRLSELGPAR